jgi:hypothetical protein
MWGLSILYYPSTQTTSYLGGAEPSSHVGPTKTTTQSEK